MNRRRFIEFAGLGTGALALSSFTGNSLANHNTPQKIFDSNSNQLNADLVIGGGGVGGCAAALAALRNNLSVILAEETDWIGGQLTQQGVPPDEHPWIETHGATALYRTFRNEVRAFYVKNYPLTESARERKYLNPGDGVVSQLCHEPRVSLFVLQSMLAPYISTGKLTLLTEHKIVAADATGSKVKAVKAINKRSGKEIVLYATYFADATELGDLYH